MTIDSIVERVADGGNLLGNLALIDVSTWEDSVEAFKARDFGVNTANMGIYRLVDGKAVFDFLGKPGNLFIDERFRRDAYSGILNNEFFLPQAEMKEHVMSAINSGNSVQVNYSGLNLKTEGCRPNNCYVEVSNNNTDEEKKLIRAVYGTETPGIGKQIFLLREEVVKAQLKDKEDELIARACYFGGSQGFGANGWGISGYGSAVRGVRLDRVGEAGAQKIEIDYASLNKQLQRPDFDPVQLGGTLSSTSAGNIAQSIAVYCARQKQ